MDLELTKLKKKMSAQPKIDQNCDARKRIGDYGMMIVSKYFESISDFMNLAKTCKDFRANGEKFHFNPIDVKRNQPFDKVFRNVEEWHVYSPLAYTDEMHGKCIYHSWHPDFNAKNLAARGINLVHAIDCPIPVRIVGKQKFDRAFQKIERRFRVINENGETEDHSIGAAVLIHNLSAPFQSRAIHQQLYQLTRPVPPKLNCGIFNELDIKDSTITEIPDYGFAHCCNLTKIVLPINLKKVGIYAFYNCPLEEIEVNVAHLVEYHQTAFISEFYTLGTLTVYNSMAPKNDIDMINVGPNLKAILAAIERAANRCNGWAIKINRKFNNKLNVGIYQSVPGSEHHFW